MTSLARALSFPLVCLALAACSSSTTDMDAGGRDAGSDGLVITFDAGPDTGPVDLGSDGGSSVGAACVSDADCPGGQCVTAMNGFPGGYCSVDCSMGEACPTGSTCVPVGRGQSLCLQDCDAAAMPRACRTGYGCGATMAGNFCLPGCTDDTDCPMGQMCDPMGGGFGAGSCYSPGAMIGGACTMDTDCPMAGACLDEAGNGYPGGACITQGCDPASGTGCPGDAVCRASRFGGGLCFDGCTMDSDCRHAYHCIADTTYPTRHYCAPHCTVNADCTVAGDVCNVGAGTCGPAFTPGDLGGACRGMAATVACDGGSCLSEGTSGFPSSYCAYLGCTPGPDATDGCPGTGTCATSRSGTHICLAHCATGTDCRAGYACLPTDRADAASPLSCQPACRNDMDCTSRGFIMDHCNTGTGFCTQTFMPANEGRPCASAAECPGGLCYTETAFGYPHGGMCVADGCRNAGTGTTGITCPTGSECVDDAWGDPDIGVCLLSCTTGTTGACPTGYGCVATGSTGTAGVCRPACAAADCTAPLTCSTTTGLCG